MLQQAGFNLSGIEAALSQQLSSLAKLQNPTGEISLSQALARVFNLADKRAHNRVTSFCPVRQCCWQPLMTAPPANC
jgi:ATP-dependent Clp protease ATP-binding subunit ClpB